MRWYAVKVIPVRNGPPVRRHVFSPKLNVTTVKLVLASTSPYRAELLQRLGMPFEVIDPGVDESLNPGESAAERALRLAKLKATAPGALPGLVIGSDQVASLNGQILQKPVTPDVAVSQLKLCSGQTVTFFTAVCVMSADPAWRGERLVTYEVTFRDLLLEEIERYVELDAPLDCAGSFKWEALGITLFKEMRGNDPTALQGLPLIALCELLRETGLSLPLGSQSVERQL